MVHEREYSEYEVCRVYGIPVSWFHEVDAAVDAWFVRNGIVTRPMREIIYSEMHLGSEVKKARSRKAGA